ncbi:MAG TPA: HEAT repeat domain-containing protein [Myxococcaceae bacterium]|nr:HEAT repeat domain-containing protein [Myxococcaceae bacterium]
MGILDIFGGSGPDKARKLKGKVTQKYGDPTSRQKAISQLGEMQIPEAISSLLARFTVTVEPLTTDADEKEHVFQLITSRGRSAVDSVREFLRSTDTSSSWAVRLLSALLTEPELIGICVEFLHQLGSTYTRNPEKKIVLIQFLTGKDDPRIAPALVPFLEDMSDDVKISAIKGLAPLKYEPSREPLLHLLTAEDTARRVQTAAIAALHESGFGVQGYREKVEALLSEPYFVDKSGLVKKRG